MVIERAKAMVETKGKLKKTHRNPIDPARFITSTSTTVHGEVADIEYKRINQEAIDKEATYDGFYGVTTNMECDINEIIAINKRRWQIEECFRIMKTDFKEDQYTYREKIESKHIF